MLPDTGQPINLKSADTETLSLKSLTEKNICADVLRLDKIHPVISGNKWFKLKYHLEDARKNDLDTIITFGGAYSNHIIATAYAANIAGIKSIGIIRGSESPVLSHTLRLAKSYGMQLEFISRFEYKKRNENSFQNIVAEKFAGAYIIPEGGAGAAGIKGCAEIRRLIHSDAYTHILCAVGTGTMLAGIATASAPKQKIIGICVLKGMQEQYKQQSGISSKYNYEINHDYHFGGYAKKNDELIRFMNNFYEQTAVPTDFVYTGKLFYAALDMVNKNLFKADSKLLIIHSGGLQGNGSLKKGTLIFDSN